VSTECNVMILPNAAKAVVDLRKLTEYILDPEHDDGKHKARLFAAALNLVVSDADELKDALLDAVRDNDAVAGKFDKFGQRYTVDFLFERDGKSAIIRSGWIIEHGANIPRLTTCYPL
jgi:hypothetical protein